MKAMTFATPPYVKKLVPIMIEFVTVFALPGAGEEEEKGNPITSRVSPLMSCPIMTDLVAPLLMMFPPMITELLPFAFTRLAPIMTVLFVLFALVPVLYPMNTLSFVSLRYPASYPSIVFLDPLTCLAAVPDPARVPSATVPVPVRRERDSYPQDVLSAPTVPWPASAPRYVTRLAVPAALPASTPTNTTESPMAFSPEPHPRTTLLPRVEVFPAL